MNKMAKINTPKKRNRKRPLLVAVAALLLLGGGLITYRVAAQHAKTEKQFAADKVRFAQTEKDMADAYAAVVAAAGQPYETKITKGCSYGAQEYGRGPLGCIINQTFTYGTHSRDESKRLGNLILSVIENHFGFSRGKTTYGLSDINQASGQYTSYLYDDNGLACTLNHNVVTLQEYNNFAGRRLGLAKQAESNYMSDFYLDCERDVPKALYNIHVNT